MTTDGNQTAKLPKDVAAAIGKSIYGYGNSLSSLSEEDLLKLSDALSPYYPLSENQSAAALAIREWLTARQVVDKVGSKLDELRNVLGMGVNRWADLVHDWRRELEYHREQRYHEERHPEFLHKELSFKLKSGDPQAMIAAVEDILENFLRRSLYTFPNVAPPEVKLPPELVAATKEFTEITQKHLSPYVERVARAKQCLAQYIYQIVAVEKIIPVKS